VCAREDGAMAPPHANSRVMFKHILSSLFTAELVACSFCQLYLASCAIVFVRVCALFVAFVRPLLYAYVCICVGELC